MIREQSYLEETKTFQWQLDRLADNWWTCTHDMRSSIFTIVVRCAVLNFGKLCVGYFVYFDLP